MHLRCSSTVCTCSCMGLLCYAGVGSFVHDSGTCVLVTHGVFMLCLCTVWWNRSMMEDSSSLQNSVLTWCPESVHSSHILTVYMDILLTCWHTVDVHVCCNVVSSYPGEQEWNNTRHTIHHPYTTSRAVDLFVTYSGVVTLAVTYLVCGWNGCEFSRNSGVNFISM